MSVGIAATSIIGTVGTASTAHAARWYPVAEFGYYTDCVNMGQEYEREGWRYWCQHSPAAPAKWTLMIYQ
ncbi:hypothetical protein [Actinoallomurus sp. CA-142502]|uniref:hypothetical protein n=1 Tax=Actinoallomurus sp. CA-142502 TaxID=3239885 RepID=UPI003D8C7647